MKIYKVGGYVRDFLLGCNPKDIDYVVVNSSESQMLKLGYEKVGENFPVFINPKNNCEYALARKERLTSNKEFLFETDNITLEEDLYRRDLTINAMAMDGNGKIIDPYGGQNDLKNKVLKHVSNYFREDPIRILRIARLSARYDFKIHYKTLKLIEEMIQTGEFDNLKEERVWKEFDKALNERYIYNFLNYLEEFGAIKKLHGFDKLFENKNLIKKISQNTDKPRLTKLILVFSQIKKENLNCWKIPHEEKEQILFFKNWKDNEFFYNSLEPQEKLTFIKQSKLLHSNSLSAEEIIKIILIYQNDKYNYFKDVNEELSIIKNDVSLIKKINYAEISEFAKKENKNVGDEIKKIQIKALDLYSEKKSCKISHQ